MFLVDYKDKSEYTKLRLSIIIIRFLKPYIYALTNGYHWIEIITRNHIIISIRKERLKPFANYMYWKGILYIIYVLGRSNGQKELNPFLFQAELPPPFWPLLFWVLVWIHENGCDYVWSAKRWITLNSSKTNMDLIYIFPRELWHTAQPILIYVLCTIQYVFVLVNKCSSQVNCEYYSFFHYVCHRCVLHTHTHTIFV